MYKRQMGYQKGVSNTGCIFSFTLLKRSQQRFTLKLNDMSYEFQVMNTSDIGISNFMKKCLIAKKVFLPVCYTNLLQFSYEIHFFLLF